MSFQLAFSLSQLWDVINSFGKPTGDEIQQFILSLWAANPMV